MGNNKHVPSLKVRQMPLSFRTAKELRGRAEILPSGPEWKCRNMTTTHPTKQPVRLYYRDPIDCLQALFRNPLLLNHVQLTPYRLFKTAERIVRVYSEWMSGNAAWEMQVNFHFEMYGYHIF